MEIYLSMFSEFLLTAPKATIEASNSVVILVMPDLGSATWLRMPSQIMKVVHGNFIDQL